MSTTRKAKAKKPEIAYEAKLRKMTKKELKRFKAVDGTVFTITRVSSTAF